MSKRRGLKGADDNVELNISPLIDMVFILLIFFIVTTVFVEEEGLDVQKPQPGGSATEDTNMIVFLINNNGRVLLDGLDIGVGGVRAAVRRETRKEKPPIIVEVENSAPSGIMVRVMDEARIAGAEAISIRRATQ